MSSKIIDWFEEKAKRLSLRSPYDEWYAREQRRMVERTVDANNRWYILQKQMKQQENQ